MNAAIHLGNGEESHAKAPETFEIPPEAARWSLSVGDYAKLMFVLDEPVRGVSVERMWVCVTRVSSTSPVRYVGELANEPAFAPMTLAERVEFGPEHVIDIERTERVNGIGSAASN